MFGIIEGQPQKIDQEVIYAYAVRKLTPPQICHQFAISEPTLWRILSEHDISRLGWKAQKVKEVFIENPGLFYEPRTIAAHEIGVSQATLHRGLNLWSTEGAFTLLQQPELLDQPPADIAKTLNMPLPIAERAAERARIVYQAAVPIPRSHHELTSPYPSFFGRAWLKIRDNLNNLWPNLRSRENLTTSNQPFG